MLSWKPCSDTEVARIYSKHQGLLVGELDPLFSSWKALMKCFQLSLWDFVPQEQQTEPLQDGFMWLRMLCHQIYVSCC